MHIHMYIYTYMYIHVYTCTHLLDCKLLEFAVRAHFFSRTYMLKQYCMIYIYLQQEYCMFCDIYSSLVYVHICIYMPKTNKNCYVYIYNLRYKHAIFLSFVHIITCAYCHMYILSYIHLVISTRKKNISFSWCMLHLYTWQHDCMYTQIHTYQTELCLSKETSTP